VHEELGNQRLKKPLADLSLERAILKEVAALRGSTSRRDQPPVIVSPDGDTERLSSCVIGI